MIQKLKNWQNKDLKLKTLMNIKNKNRKDKQMNNNQIFCFNKFQKKSRKDNNFQVSINITRKNFSSQRTRTKNQNKLRNSRKSVRTLASY